MEVSIAFSHWGLVTKDLAKTEQCQLGKAKSRHKHCGGLVVETGFTIGDRQEDWTLSPERRVSDIVSREAATIRQIQQGEGEYLNWQMKHERISEIEPYAEIR